MRLAPPPCPSLVLRGATLVVGLCLVVARAEAQLPDPPLAPSATEREVARDAFLEGMAHAERARWAAALEAFDRSYRLSGSPVALFNLASTLRSLGRAREATEALERLLAAPELDPEARARAERLRAECEARIGRLAIDGVPPGDAEVLVDGRARGPVRARPVVVALDPGLRVVRLELGARAPFTWSGEVADGARLSVDAGLGATRREAPPPRTEDQQDNLPIVVLVTALGAVALGALALGLALGLPPSLAPRSGLVIALP